MSESILNALIQLYALVANATGTANQGRILVKSMLKQQLNTRFVGDYLDLFDNYLDFFNRDTPEAIVDTQQGRDLLSSYVEKVCTQLRKGLAKTERIVVFIKLLEYVNADKKVTSLEEHIIDNLAHCFSIAKIELQNLKSFVLHVDCEEIDGDKLLVIESKRQIREDLLEGIWVEENRPDWLLDDRQILNEAIEGKLAFLHVDSINTFIVRYYGTAELYLDGKRIESGRPYLVESGAIIRGPKIDPIYYTDLTSRFNKSLKRQRIVFTAENLEFNFRNSSNGIQPFSFSEESGNLIGIMGGSGVGKSTLLNLLTGKLIPKRGRVLINGYDIHRDMYAVEGIIGYVPQDDLLFENLTVYQNLYYNAKLCFSNFTEFKLRQTVKQILDDLDLWEIRSLKVGSPLNKMISGGQRKRLNIGLELMREPSILFVDEPTSGLSSSDSLMVMRLLKRQVNHGKLVIVNIHQPSSKVFRLLDKLWVLDKGGYPIYTGNPQDAIVYFKTMSTQVNATESGCPHCGTLNPEQILEIIEAKVVDSAGNHTNVRLKSPKEWNSLYQSNIHSNFEPKQHKGLLPKNFFNIPNIEVQFQIFSLRNILSKLSNKQYVFINLLEAPVLAFILSYFTKYIPGDAYVFADNKNFPAYLFMSIVVALFLGLTVSAEEIISDKKILERESFLNLSRFSYHSSKVIYLFSLSAVQMAMFVLVGNTILEIHGMMLNFWLILFSTACFANMMGLNLSAGLNSVVAIYITIPFILVPQILLSGTVVQFDNLHPSTTQRVYVPVVGDLMISRWGYEALAVEQFKKNQFEKSFFEHEQEISYASFVSTFLIPRMQSLLEECERLQGQETPLQYRIDRNLNILRNEILVLTHKGDVPPFEFTQQLNTTSFTSEMADELSGYLYFLRLTYNNIASKARNQRDSIYTALSDSIGSQAIQDLRRQNYNKTLADWVLNTHEVSKYLETDGRVIRKFEPIFMIPEHNWGRAHFYAPVKRFNNQYVDTIWFNLAVMWLASLLLFVTLQVNLLGNVMSYFERMRLNRVSRRYDKVLDDVKTTLNLN
ncbi:MAG: ATP-binding cassette domain-containing protein [Tenuifilaceae bacterium]|jgi:ABC-type multidrug transport system ATPase subunit|nr:ATP-binding cassette domain-containing protein [Tenuifilaceae bacterium]